MIIMELDFITINNFQFLLNSLSMDIRREFCALWILS